MNPFSALDNDNTNKNLDWQESHRQKYSGYCLLGLGFLPALSSFLLLWDFRSQKFTFPRLSCK